MAGRNVLNVYVESADPVASESENPEFANRFFLDRDRAFWFQDQDRDGISDTAEAAGGTIATNPDSDGDGLPDSVESELPSVSASGTVVIATVTPAPIIAGHALAIEGTGMEDVSLPTDLTFDGLPAGEILYRSPRLVVARAPSSLVPGSSVAVRVGGPFGAQQQVDVADVMAPTAIAKNLVLMTSGDMYNFVINGQISPAGFANQTLFVNLANSLFGAGTRIVVDASTMAPAFQGNPITYAGFAYDIEKLFIDAGSGPNVSTNVDTLTEELLEETDLLFLISISPIRSYSASELDAIEAWFSRAGRRLVVISDSDSANAAHEVFNPVLARTGTLSLFDVTFPERSEQDTSSGFYTLSAGITIDPPITDGVSQVWYRAPADLIRSPFATQTVLWGLCVLPTTNVIDQNGFLVGCNDDGNVLPPIEGTLVATETLPTESPTVMIEKVNGIDIPAGEGGLVELNPRTQLLPQPTDVSIEASFENITPTVVKINGQVTMHSGNTVTATLPGFLPATSEGRGILVEVEDTNGPEEIRAADSIVVRARREGMSVRVLRFASMTGELPIDPGEFDELRRQAGLELLDMCLAEKLQAPDPVRPGLSDRIPVLSDETVQDQAGFELLIEQIDPITGETVISDEVFELLAGERPGGGDPAQEIPDPTSEFPSPLRAFVARRFLEEVNTVSGGQQRVARVQGFTLPGDDAVFLRSGHNPAADEPVVGRLGHELLHAGGAALDNSDESPVSGRPVWLPNGQESSLNSLPHYRSLELGTAAVESCTGGDVSSTEQLCGRLFDGSICPGFFSEARDYTE